MPLTEAVCLCFSVELYTTGVPEVISGGVHALHLSIHEISLGNPSDEFHTLRTAAEVFAAIRNIPKDSNIWVHGVLQNLSTDIGSSFFFWGAGPEGCCV